MASTKPDPEGCAIWAENYIMDHLTLAFEDGADDTAIRAEWFKLLASGRWSQPQKIADYAKNITNATLMIDTEEYFRQGLRTVGVAATQIDFICRDVFAK